MPTPALSLFPIPGIPEIEPGCDLADTLFSHIDDAGVVPHQNDIFVVAQKIVSRAEDRFVDLSKIEPTQRALDLNYSRTKDPRLAELILQESTRVVRDTPMVLITEHKLGIVLANAGIDRSNVRGDDDTALLLPVDPDSSAKELRRRILARYQCDVGVIVSDSLGRPWRLGTTGVAIGSAGIKVLDDQRGASDRYGRVLQVAEIATADSVAAAAGLIMGEGAQGLPLVIVRGLDCGNADQTARDVLRPAAEDLFR